MPAVATLKVQIEMVPTEGDPMTTEVQITPKITLREALTAAGISGDGKDFTVNGKPATLDTPIGDGSKVTAKSRPVHVRGEERPAGS